MSDKNRGFRACCTVQGLRASAGMVLLTVLMLVTPGLLHSQDVVQTAAERTITISRGSTAILTRPDSITVLDIGDQEIADVNPYPPNQVAIYAKNVGSTSLIVWGRSGPPRLYTIEVTADVQSLQRQVDELFPGAGLSVTSTGTSVVLSGEVRDPAIVRKAEELAATTGIPVVNNVAAPAPEQILLHVEFAEVSRSVLREIGGDLVRILNPENLGEALDFGEGDTHEFGTVSEGFVTIQIAGNEAALDAIINALKSTGEFQSLAQPNLVTREGQEASFLAGGEFPFPTIQGGGNTNAVTIEWKEFGVRLNFTPSITNNGNIRLQVEPEVSSLDFANGLTYQGFEIPALLSRRVSTDVELRPGQTLAIGGLLDSSLLEDMEKIPLLGDIPILGFFFRKERTRQDRRELLVLVTPHILDTDNLPVQALPTGDSNDWDWDGSIREWIQERARGRSGGGGSRPGGS